MRIIEREIFINATIARVWEHLTDSKRIAGWLMANNFEPVVGKEFVLDCQQQGKDACVVKEILPQQKLVYSFRSRVTRVETLVTITLTADGKGTLVKLVHSGWDALPPDEQGIADQYGSGWGCGLEKLREQVGGSGTG